jgi:sec-independent protein translocase protein TatA
MSGTFLAIGGLGAPELIIILLIVVVVFGVGKLSDVGKQLGSGIRNFKDEMNREDEDDAPAQLEEEPPREMDSAPRDVTDEHKNRA